MQRKLNTQPQVPINKQEKEQKKNEYPNPKIKEKEKFQMELQSKRKLDNEGSEVMCLRIDNDDEHVVSGCSKGMIRIFNLWSGKLINKIAGNKQQLPIQSVHFKSKQKYHLLTASTDGTIQLNHILTNKNIYEIKEENNNQILTMDLQGESFATAGSDQIIRIYDEETQSVSSRLASAKYVQNSHSNRIYQVKYIDNNSMISGGTDRNVLLWDLRSGQVVQSLFGPVVLGQQMDVYQHHLAVGSNSLKDSLLIYDLRNLSRQVKDLNLQYTPQEQAQFPTIDMIFSLNFSKNHQNLSALFCTAYDKVMFYDVNSDFKPFAQIYSFDATSYCSDSGNLSDKFLFGSSLGVIYYLKLAKAG